MSSQELFGDANTYSQGIWKTRAMLGSKNHLQQIQVRVFQNTHEKTFWGENLGFKHILTRYLEDYNVPTRVNNKVSTCVNISDS